MCDNVLNILDYLKRFIYLCQNIQFLHDIVYNQLVQIKLKNYIKNLIQR